MSGESPKATSPLIGAEGSTDAKNGFLGVVVDELEITPQQELELAATRSHVSGTKSGGTMKYHDIVPGKGPAMYAKTFSDIVDLANVWLEKNRDVRVTSAETIVWQSNDKRKLGDSEYMIVTQRLARDVPTYYMRGLRLWLISARECDKTSLLRHIYVGPDGPSDTHAHILAKLNSHLEKRDIKGRVVRIQTEQLPLQGDTLQLDSVEWVHDLNHKSAWAFSLIVFYLDQGTPPSVIAMEDFVPMETVGGYEVFEKLVERASAWLKEQHNSSIVTIESFMTFKGVWKEPTKSTSCYVTVPSIETMRDNSDALRILRVFVCESGEGYTKASKGLASENFQPKLIMAREEGGSMRERGERMVETFHRMAIYAAEIEVVAPETVLNIMQLVDKGEHEPDAEVKYLFSLRLFLTGDSAEKYRSTHAPLVRSNSQRRQNSFRRASKRKKQKELEESEHPGPIFLRNVVMRRFKYRWLVVGVTAFIAMSGIVIVSVVYSNT